jgi:glycine/serine hydroxymethyltransferase
MQVKANAAALGARLMKHGYKLITDGTDNHLVLWDLKKEARICFTLHHTASSRHTIC